MEGINMNKDLCFQNKLNTLYSCIFHEPNSAENIELKRIDNSKEALDGWNKALHLFYNVFAKQKRFMKCLYDIKTPEELVVDNNFMIIAKERQSVCAYGIEIDNGKIIYVDNTNEVAEPLNIQIEDFILYLIAIQSSEFSLCSGKISNCSNLLRTQFDEQRISNQDNEGAVYYFNEGVILVVNGDDALVSAADDTSMEKFEADTAFDVDYF